MQGIFSVDMLGLHVFMQIIGKLKKEKKKKKQQKKKKKKM